MYKSFCVGHLGFDLSLKESIPLAVKYGYEGVIIDVVSESQTDPLELKALLADNGLKPGGFGFPVNFREGREAFEG